jgi:hypothetical protein
MSQLFEPRSANWAAAVNDVGVHTLVLIKDTKIAKNLSLYAIKNMTQEEIYKPTVTNNDKQWRFYTTAELAHVYQILAKVYPLFQEKS